RRRQVQRSRRTKALAGARVGTAGVDEEEIHRVAVVVEWYVVRRGSRGFHEQRAVAEAAAPISGAAAVAPNERGIQVERRQRRIAGTFLVGRVPLRRRTGR